MSSPCLGTPPAPVVLVERTHLDQAALDALGFLQRHEAIGVVGDKVLQTLPVFVKAVAAEEPYVRFAALWALRQIWLKGGASFGKKQPLELVESCEQGFDNWWCELWADRRRVVERWKAAVAAIDVPKLTEVLLHKLDDEDFWVQRQAISTVATIHSVTPQSELCTQRMLAALLSLTKAPNPFIREMALRSLSSWGDLPAVRTAYIEANRDNTWWVRRLGDVRQLAVAREALRDADPAIRVMAIRGLMLGAIGAGSEAIASIREVLLERVRDPHGEVSSEAVFSLIDLNDKEAIGPLLELLEFPHSNALNKDFIEQALRKLSGKSLAELHQDFPGHVERPMVEVDYAPVRRKNPVHLHRLYQEVEAGSWTARISALLELTWVQEPAAYVAIKEGLGDRDARVRYVALELLRWQLNSFGVRDPFHVYLDNIHRALHDVNRHVQKVALDLVGAVGMGGGKRYFFGGKWKRLMDEVSEKAVQAEDGFIRQAAINAILRWE